MTALETIGIVVEGAFVVYKIEKDVIDNIFLAAALEGKTVYYFFRQRGFEFKKLPWNSIITPKLFLDIIRKQMHEWK